MPGFAGFWADPDTLNRVSRRFWIKLTALCLIAISSSHAAMQSPPPGDENLFSQSDPAETVVGIDRQPQAQPDLFQQLQLKAASEFKANLMPPASVRLCDSCHSRQQQQGNSYLPILQGQNQEYLFAKIISFKNNRHSRHPFPMYSNRLSEDEIMQVSLYYARQVSDLTKTQVVSVKQLVEDAEQQELSISSCADCHGVDGNGDQLIPAISGQNIRYLMYRIREIARQDSQVHLESVAAVDCRIPPVGLRESEALANQWAMVVDDQRAARGAGIYRDNCAGCHNHGEREAPILSEHQAWTARLRQGTRELVKSALIGKNNMPFWGGNIRLSRQQITDAIHYMIERISSSE